MDIKVTFRFSSLISLILIIDRMKTVVFVVVLALLTNNSDASSIHRGNHTRVKRADSTCNLSGVCGQTAKGVIPCVVNNEPHKFEGSSQVLAILKDECPELFPDGVTIPDVCCSEEDVKQFQAFIKMISSQFTNCPDCLQNSKEFLCHYHCAPNQKDFIEIVKQNGNAVEEINYYVNEASLNGLFATCEKLPAMQQFLKMTGCQDCGVKDFVKAMGDKNLQSAFQMNVIISKSGSPTVNGRPGKPVEFLVITGKQCS